MRIISEDALNALIKRCEEHNYKAQNAKENNEARVIKIRERLAQLPEEGFTSDPRQQDFSLLKEKIEAFLVKGTFTEVEVQEIERETLKLVNYIYDALESELNEASYKS